MVALPGVRWPTVDYIVRSRRGIENSRAVKIPWVRILRSGVPPRRISDRGRCNASAPEGPNDARLRRPCSPPTPASWRALACAIPMLE
jgi:hypothetical protein